MTDIYQQIRTHAREIVGRHPIPRFYRACAAELAASERFFRGAPMLAELEALVAREEDLRLGHGLDHSRKVTIEAGALVILEIQAGDKPTTHLPRRVLVAHCAGLLHDIRRGKPDHAAQGARRAAQVLAQFPLSPTEVADICAAIGNHVAFHPPQPLTSPEGQLLSDVLYDADKFRWGPDNFNYMLWDMVAAWNPSLNEFIRRFPKGLSRVGRIRDSFRSVIGKRYGPEFIDLGLAMGAEILEMVRRDFGPSQAADTG